MLFFERHNAQQAIYSLTTPTGSFDPSTQLFIEVVEVPKPFCVRHNFEWWAEIPWGESGSKISRTLGSWENDVAGVKLLFKISAVGVQLYCLSSLKRKRTINNWHNYVFFLPFFLFHSHPQNNFCTHLLRCGSWSLLQHITMKGLIHSGQVTRLAWGYSLYKSLFYIAN